MYEYTCVNCGKVVKVQRKWQLKTFCSKSCAVAYRYKVKYEQQGGSCIYHPVGVICYRQECSKCGWNPEVAQARLEKIMEGV